MSKKLFVKIFISHPIKSYRFKLIVYNNGLGEINIGCPHFFVENKEISCFSRKKQEFFIFFSKVKDESASFLKNIVNIYVIE